MSAQKALQEFYELGALRLLRTEKIPIGSVEQDCRHTIMGISKDNAPAFFWARRVYRTEDNKETYVEVTFTTPIKRSQGTPVMVPPGVYLVSTKRREDQARDA
jgi:hypothetical protein